MSMIEEVSIVEEVGGKVEKRARAFAKGTGTGELSKKTRESSLDERDNEPIKVRKS